MPNTLKSPAKVHAATSFLNSFYDDPTNKIYIGIADAGGEWSVPATPDIPRDSYQQEIDFWGDIVGMAEVNLANDTDLVVPRKTWVSGATYVVFSAAAYTGTGSFDVVAGRDFYVCNTDVSNPKVYQCLLAGGGTSTNEPTHNDPDPIGTEADGYKWGYLYTVGSPPNDVFATLLTNSWLPVPTSAPAYTNSDAGVAIGSIRLGDDSAGYKADKIYQSSLIGTSGPTLGATMFADTANIWVEWQAPLILGAYYVGLSVNFPDHAGTSNEISNIPYRQVALLRNPRNASSAFITSPYYGTGTGAGGFEAIISRDVCLAVDNRTTISRAVGQTETIRLILEF